jgi:predicted amidohydrolase
MESFRIAAVQMNALKDDLEHNLEVHRKFAAQAAADGCRIVMFPEISATAHYGDSEVLKFAEEAGDGKVYRSMREASKRHGIIIAYGFAEKAHGTYYNAYALVGPDGTLGLQRKVVASGDEYYAFRMGRSLDVFDLGFCRIGTLVCYDRSFSEHWRIMALRGAEVILQPSAGRRGGKEMDVPKEAQLKRLAEKLDEMPGELGTYAAENGLFVAHCNQIGFNGHSTHNGGACIIGPQGDLKTKSPLTTDDVMVSFDLDAGEVDEARKRKNYTLKNRRPELYGDIAKMI